MTWIVIGYLVTAMAATSLGLLAGSCLAAAKMTEAHARIATLEAALAEQTGRSDRLNGALREMARGGLTRPSADASGIDAALHALSGS